MASAFETIASTSERGAYRDHGLDPPNLRLRLYQDARIQVLGAPPNEKWVVHAWQVETGDPVPMNEVGHSYPRYPSKLPDDQII